MTLDLSSNSVEVHLKNAEPWRISLIDTGLTTMTGGRIKRVGEYINGTFCLTYGDGLSDVNLKKLVSQHKKSGKLATVTAVQPEGRFGS